MLKHYHISVGARSCTSVFLYTTLTAPLIAQHFYPPIATALEKTPFGFKLGLDCFASKEALGDEFVGR